jgi:hypothetical protein
METRREAEGPPYGQAESVASQSGSRAMLFRVGAIEVPGLLHGCALALGQQELAECDAEGVGPRV